jgi:hypothetical protein
VLKQFKTSPAEQIEGEMHNLENILIPRLIGIKQA